MRFQNAAVMLPLLVAIAAGCTTMGTGTGSTPSGASVATFNWKSSDGVSGTIDATLAGGKTYSGQYFQITKDTTVDSIGPLWAGGGGLGRRVHPSDGMNGGGLGQCQLPNGTSIDATFPKG
jgi:hypothetical protein